MNGSSALTGTSSIRPAAYRILTGEQWVLLLTAGVQLVSPPLVISLSGRNIGDSPGDVPRIIPAGYAFVIWGVITLGAAAFAVYQAMPAQRERSFYPVIRRPAIFVFTGFTLWLVAAVAQWLWVTVAIFAGMLWGLWRILPPILAERSRWTGPDRWLVAFPFALYAGWTTVAVFANVASALTYSGWRVSGPFGLLWQGALLIGATLAALYGVRRTRGDLPYAGAVLWPLAAIIVRNAESVSPAQTGALLVAGHAPEKILIGLAAAAAALVVGATVFFRRQR